VYPTLDELLAGLEAIGPSPRDVGIVDLIVRRPAAGVREVLQAGSLDPEEGLIGDSWRTRAARRNDMQLTIVNARVMRLLTPDRTSWPLAGDQLFVDLDLSTENIPPGMRLVIGETAVVEVSAVPHTGCGKFVQRFGTDAARFVNSATGTQLRLRGLNAKILASGAIRIGDLIQKR
jgi:hypothetical protein